MCDRDDGGLVPDMEREGLVPDNLTYAKGSAKIMIPSHDLPSLAVAQHSHRIVLLWYLLV